MDHWNTYSASFLVMFSDPLVFFVLLWRSRKKLTKDIHAKFRYSTLLVGYREERYYWEAVISLRALLLLSVCFSCKLVFVCRLWQLSHSLHAYLCSTHTCNPSSLSQNTEPLHMGDFLALITAFLTLSAGLYLFQNVGESESFQSFLTFVIIFVMYVIWGLSLTGTWH